MHYYSIEFADSGDPNAPLTERQLTAGAQVVEALATHGVFPLQAANRPSQQGLAVYHMGRIAWEGHTSISRDFPWVPPTPCQVLTSTAQISPNCFSRAIFATYSYRNGGGLSGAT